jgi:hypothetical protein
MQSDALGAKLVMTQKNRPDDASLMNPIGRRTGSNLPGGIPGGNSGPVSLLSVPLRSPLASCLVHGKDGKAPQISTLPRASFHPSVLPDTTVALRTSH